MDFTVNKYNTLLKSLADQNYTFQTFDEFITAPSPRSIILRHDVDLLPYNSLAFAKIQAENNISGTYYFRAVPESWNEEVILEIFDLGHEIGYHYECLTTCNGDLKKGIKDFEDNLTALRKLVPVSTICMHGSPMSKHDSKDLWKTYDYKNYDIIAEPYFDVDFEKVFYLTDTGRRWDGHKVSVRDRVKTSFNETFHSTDNIINVIDTLPDTIMFTFHPQRWNDNRLLWTKELISQNTKNIVKKYFFVQK
ncbi:hypothetical protein [Aquimarina muelleri]|uniref:Polysaccharide deacetylase n=1 Tax=Aquimarina muelleri TaxID=279356 RepID=A0A918JR35_9FLAO|nr:hypothetical protein [Aquimarina muelleri]MCX2762065.1 hypothetical protein [Aquimarina muelleri]GGX04180.1 hypothetical protein GCM10007384_02470 [Aquimarina muelleri]